MTGVQPAYLRNLKSGALREGATEAVRAMAACRLCPRQCGVDRLSGETGFCNTGRQAVVSSFNAHFGEEAPLVGRSGSGTIFFTHCNLLCNFCQNFDISHRGAGKTVSARDLADIMLSLQKKGCHNINFVTPSHVVPQILEAVERAAEDGLTIPLVYNSGGYDRIRTLKRLQGVFDIYMPDFKFWSPSVADETCQAPDYPEVARNAVAEMHRQVGDLVLDEDGIATRGLLVRHLVMPNGLGGTPEIMGFIAERISTNTYVNVMAQYRPFGRAPETRGLERALTPEEFEMALQAARKAGLTRIDRPARRFMFI
jgi:putative pyruvate formate lyase activating enzyme